MDKCLAREPREKWDALGRARLRRAVRPGGSVESFRLDRVSPYQSGGDGWVGLKAKPLGGVVEGFFEKVEIDGMK